MLASSLMIKNPLLSRFFTQVKVSPLMLRCLSCGVLFPLGAAIIFLPLTVSALPLMGLATLVIWEWIRLVEITYKWAQILIIAGVLFAMGLGIYGKTRWSFSILLLGAVGYYYIGVWGGMIYSLKNGHTKPNSVQGNAVFWGMLYIGIPFLSFIALRLVSGSDTYLFWILSIVWSTDTMAYIIGSLLKGPKLWIRLSPSKTWSGVLGGIGSAGGVAWGVGHIVLDETTAFLVGWGLLFGILSILGDLLESAMKRYFVKKDSGSLIPGHGGLLDRLDSALVVVPLAALLFYWKYEFFQGGW